MKVPITAPASALPKRDPEDPFVCECMFRPIDLARHIGRVMWLKAEGDAVAEGEPICEADVDKKTIELFAPGTGKLAGPLLPEDGAFRAGDIIGYVEEGSELG